MEHTKLRVSLFLLCILNLICLSTQYGQVWVDQINPAKTDEVYFHSITSDNATVGDLNVQTLTVSHPEGLIVEIPGSLGFGGSAHDIIGALGVSLGSENSESISIASAGTFTSLSEVFAINVDDAYIRGRDDVIFQSTRGVHFRSDFFNLDGLFGTVIKSTEENVEISSGVEISSHTEVVSLEANSELFVQSQSGSVEIEGSQAVNGNAESISLTGLLGTQLVAQGNILVHAEDLFQGYAATTTISSLFSTSVYSPSNVDFTAADSILARAASHASISADQEIYVGAVGDTGSSVTVKSSNDINLDVDNNATFSAFAIRFDSIEQTLTSDVLSVSSIEKFAVGSDATKSIFIDSASNNVVFSVSEDAAGELGVTTFFTKLISQSIASISSSNDIKVVSTNIKTHANDISFDTDIFTAYALTANGRLQYKGAEGTTLNAGINVNYAARDEVYIGYSNVDTEIDNNIDANFAQDLSVSADGQISLLGGRLTVNGKDVTYTADGYVNLTGGDYTISTVVGDITFASTDKINLQALDASFISNRGDIHINALDAAAFESVLVLTFDSTDDLSIVSYGDVFNVKSANNLVFQLSPESDGVNGLSSFIVGLDYSFTAPLFFAAGEDLLYSTGSNMQLSSLANSNLTAPEILFKTFSNEPAGGITLSASNVLSFFADGGDITFDSANDLSFSANIYNFVTKSFSFVSSQSLNFGSAGQLYINATDLLKVASDGEVTFSTPNDIEVNSLGDISHNAAGDINIETYYSSFETTGNFEAQGSNIYSRWTYDTTYTGTGDFNATAAHSGSYIKLTSFQDALSFSGDNFRWNSDNVNVTTGGFQNTANDGDIVINTTNMALNAREFLLQVSGDQNIQAGSIEFGTEEFMGTYTQSSSQLSISAGEQVAFTSEGDITWNVKAGDTFVTTHDLYLKASNSEGFYSNLDINFVAPGGDNDIEVLSHGGAELKAVNDITINSDNDMLWKAQRSLIFRTNDDGIFLFAEDGNFLVESAASILYEASDAVDLIAYNTAGTASANFLADDGILLQSDRNGISFLAEGFVPSSNDGIFINSTSLHGDVIFTSNDGDIIMNTPGAITYTSAAKLSHVSAYDQTYTAQLDLSFSAFAGGLNFKANTGVNITAGNPASVSNLYVLQPQSFHSVATSQINIRSEGPVVGNAIEIVSEEGSIQFITADASDIYLFASNDQTFNGGKSYKIESNEDIQSRAPGGPIIFEAVTNGRFVTEGGPIQLTTQTGQSNGNINLYAIAKNITFQSGNSAVFTAKQQFQLDAFTDIDLSSADGSFAVSADSATSVIEATAAGYVKITSTGTRKTPYDGVYLEAANNVEIGTVATDTVSFNALNYFIIGDVSRPIVNINAGGSPTLTGFSITSDGDISAISENVVQFDINGELIYSGATSITSYSSGPSNIVSTGTGGLGENIVFTSALGTIKLEANYFDLEAPNGIKSVTSGILHINQFGDTRNNKILMNSPLVTFTNQGNHLWDADHVDADLTSSYSLTTKGPGAIVGEDSGRSVLAFQANSLFTIKSGELLTFTSERNYGQIDFKTTGAGSTLTLQTALQSSIEVTSADTISIYGDVTTFSAGDKITFEAQDAISDVNAPNGDISFYTTGKINATSQADVTFSTNENVHIQSTGFEAGEGFPVRFTSTDELSIKSALDLTIQNAYNEGGSIEFQALSDLTIENSQGAGDLISFTADENISFEVARDYTVNVNSGGFSATVGSDISFVATGIDSVDDFGIQFITESQGDGIDFRSLFGDVSFTASESITITADLNNIDSTTSSMFIESRQSGSFTSVQDMTITAEDQFLSETRAGSTYLVATNEFLVETTASTSSINFETNGVDANGLYAIKYTAEADLATVEVSSKFGSITVESSEELVLQGEFVDISSFKPVTFKTVFGEILIEAQLNVTFFTYSDITLKSAYQTDFISSGTVYANCDGDVTFSTLPTGKSTGVDIDMRTTGTDADLFYYTSGKMSMEAAVWYLARTAELPGSDLKITTTLGHITIDATSESTGVKLNLESSFGNFTVSSFGDDGDIYIRSTSLDVQVDGDIVFTSSLSSPLDGVIIGVTNAITVQSELLTFRGKSLAFDAATAFTVTTAVGYTGGSINIISTDATTGFTNNAGVINFGSFGPGSDIVFESQIGDFNFYPNGGASTVVITQNSIMKIPHNDFKGTSNANTADANTCRTGEMFFTSATNLLVTGGINTSDAYVCMCLSTGNLRCVRFEEPPGNSLYPGLV